MSKLKVPFTEQQLTLLRKLLEEKQFGSSTEQVLLNIYREYTRVLFRSERTSR